MREEFFLLSHHNIEERFTEISHMPLTRKSKTRPHTSNSKESREIQKQLSRQTEKIKKKIMYSGHLHFHIMDFLCSVINIEKNK